MRLGEAEVRLLVQVVDELDLLLSGGADADQPATSDQPAPAASTDPLAEMAGLDWPDSTAVETPTDPALRRLLPDAYRDDDAAAAEFRRYTDATLRGEKRADATVVRQGLASIAVTGKRVLDDRQTQAWLRCLTDARLVLASRLDIEKADDHQRLARLDADDPRTMIYTVYSWLGGLLEDLLAAIGAT